MISPYSYSHGRIWLNLDKQAIVMAILPYTATLVAPKLRELDQVQEWCLQMWPCTHRATWYQDNMTMQVFARFEFKCTWSFQFREDLTMFLLTWAHLVDSHE